MSEKKMEATKVSIDRSIDKEDVVYSYTIECYSAKKRTKYLFFFCGSMDRSTKSGKDKYHMVSLICGI